MTGFEGKLDLLLPVATKNWKRVAVKSWNDNGGCLLKIMFCPPPPGAWIINGIEVVLNQFLNRFPSEPTMMSSM